LYPKGFLIDTRLKKSIPKMSLPALPDELNDRRRLRRDVVSDEGGQNLIGHPIFFACPEQRLLLEIKAVLAVEIHMGPMGFARPGCPAQWVLYGCSPSFVQLS
jgi:hypothetical protein